VVWLSLFQEQRPIGKIMAQLVEGFGDEVAANGFRSTQAEARVPPLPERFDRTSGPAERSEWFFDLKQELFAGLI
jgi:hypothetical protein